MNSKKYVLPAFTAVFALMFVAATPHILAEPGQGQNWDDGDYHGDYANKDIRQDMAEKLNSYCEMSPEEQSALIKEHNKTEEMVAKMNEYCSLDEAGKQAFVEEHKEQYRKHHHADKQNDKYNKHHQMMVKVEGFVGAIPVPDMSEVEDKKAVYEELESQITVKLSEAAAAAEDAGLDITKGELGKAVNENNEKFLVWKLIEKNNDDADSDMITKTILVIDAADITNTATVTKEYNDHSMKDEKRHSYDKDHKNTLSDPEKIEDKIAKIEQKINEGNLGPEQTENKVQFVYLLRQLQICNF